MQRTALKAGIGVVVLIGVVGALIWNKGGPTTRAAAYGCTRVLGFSQTDQWYEGGSFESHVDGTEWELFWYRGGRVDAWKSPSSAMWMNGTLFSPCVNEPPDRVIFNVAPSKEQHADVSSLVSDLTAVVATIRLELPAVTTIVLQPLVGGPHEGLCHDGYGNVVNASYIHPFAEQAISQVVNGTDIIPGADPHVSECGMFVDSTGHLTEVGSTHLGAVLGAYWGAASP
jgi:hypothetical protein